MMLKQNFAYQLKAQSDILWSQMMHYEELIDQSGEQVRAE